MIEAESNKQADDKTETADSVVKLADSEMIKPQLSDAELKAQRIKQAKDYFNQELDNRIDRFLKQQKSVSWLSFSYLEWKAVENLKKTN